MQEVEIQRIRIGSMVPDRGRSAIQHSSQFHSPSRRRISRRKTRLNRRRAPKTRPRARFIHRQTFRCSVRPCDCVLTDDLRFLAPTNARPECALKLGGRLRCRLDQRQIEAAQNPHGPEFLRERLQGERWRWKYRWERLREDIGEVQREIAV